MGKTLGNQFADILERKIKLAIEEGRVDPKLGQLIEDYIELRHFELRQASPIARLVSALRSRFANKTTNNRGHNK